MKPSLLLAIFFAVLSNNTLAATPVCEQTNDPDNDGWGWENNASCRMPTTNAGNNTNTNADSGSSNSNTSELTLSTLLAQCITELSNQNNSSTNTGTNASDPTCVDTAPVGDGWGWNGRTSCRVTTSTQQTAQCSTSDSNNAGSGGSQGGQYGTGYTDNTNAQPTCQEASDRILRLVTTGMHESEVLRLVGKPRDVSGGGSFLYWDYSTNNYNYPRITFNHTARTVRNTSVNTEYCRR